MGSVLRMKCDRGAPREGWSINDLKMQIAHNIALDKELSGNQSKVAHALLFVLIDSATGFCYRKDDELAEIVSISVGTLRKAVRNDPAFRNYFHVKPGGRKRATEYQLTQEAIDDAARRRARQIGQFERANGEMAISGNAHQMNEGTPLVAKIATKYPESGKSRAERRQKTPLFGGKNYPPNPEDKPIENPSCAAEAAPQTVDFEEVSRSFFEAFPRIGKPDATEQELRKAIAVGTDPEAILRGAWAYASEQSGNDPRYIAYSENWLREQRWTSFQTSGEISAETDENRATATRVEAIRSGQSWRCTMISAAAARGLIAAGLVTHDQCAVVGIRP
ncbi:MAG: hypothetical protein AAGL89_03970 [Pseudomonadota bacterium]